MLPSSILAVTSQCPRREPGTRAMAVLGQPAPHVGTAPVDTHPKGPILKGAAPPRYDRRHVQSHGRGARCARNGSIRGSGPCGDGGVPVSKTLLSETKGSLRSPVRIPNIFRRKSPPPDQGFWDAFWESPSRTDTEGVVVRGITQTLATRRVECRPLGPAWITRGLTR